MMKSGGGGIGVLGVLLLCTVLPYYAAFVEADFVGCGGFILSALKEQRVDFTQIKVKVVTSEGSVKEQTEAAPTGYYYLAVYDKGNFKLVLEGPQGWNFAPSEVAITITEDNKCIRSGSKTEEDINFELTGFTVSGSVVGEHCAVHAGPPGVHVKLYAITDSKKEHPIREAMSDSTGKYHFTNVAPGQYIAQASHSHWSFRKAEEKVSVEWGNAQVAASLIVVGYSVKGRVTSNGEPVPNVQFLIYSNDANVNLKCTIPSEFKDWKEVPLCVEQSGKNGEFQFVGVPCGNYKLVPYYKGQQDASFDVSPKFAEVSVVGGDVHIASEFKVKGFSLSGRAVHASGKPVKEAKILVNGEEKAITDENGNYRLDEISTNALIRSIQAVKAHLHFSSIESFQVSPSVPTIPDLVVEEYDICGRVYISHYPTSASTTGLASKERKVNLLTSSHSVVQTGKTDASGNFCMKSKSGEYIVQAVVSKEEEAGGLVLNPKDIAIKLEDDWRGDLLFTQTRVAVSGFVKCLHSPCDPQIAVTMESASTHAKVTTSLSPLSAGKETGNSFIFRDVLPGNYFVYITNKENYCWQKNNVNVNVAHDDITNLVFNQEGYLLALTSPLTVPAEIVSSKDGSKQQVNVIEGKKNYVCLKEEGHYKIVGGGCFKYTSESYEFATKEDVISEKDFSVELIPTHFTVSGSIVIDATPGVDVGSHKISLTTINKLTGQESVQELSGTVTKGDKYAFKYSVWAKLGDQVEIKPRSSLFMFYPHVVNVHATERKCIELNNIVGRKGLFIKGTVTPALSGVNVAAFIKDSDQDAVAVVQSDAKGDYTVGPLFDDKEYTLKASLDGYTFKSEGQNFVAHKLGRVIVSVVDGSAPITGVLLSLSGHLYRSNNFTNANGEFVFLNLLPGEYYLKAILKEYQFEPSSFSFNLQDGEDKTISINGIRVGWSCYGSVKSIVGDPEKSVTVEAVSSSGSFEQAQTDASGLFRIRGLLPNTAYNVSVNIKASEDKLERSTPSSVPIVMEAKDYTGIQFVVFRKPTKFELSVSLSTAKEYLSSVTVAVYKEGEQSPLFTSSAGPSNYVQFDGLARGVYKVKITSNLSQQIYKHQPVEQTVQIADSHQHLSINYEVHLQGSEELQELSSAPFFAIVVGALIVFGLFYRDTVVETVQTLKESPMFKNVVAKNAPAVVNKKKKN